MPKIHLFKEDRRPDGSRITHTLEISPLQLSALPDCSSEFSPLLAAANPDLAGPNPASCFYAVVEIPVGEATDRYPYEGFYLLEEISPTELRAALG